MTNQACVAVGIDHYLFLPPLNYGQADAQAIWQFWVGQANLPSERCLLLTDTSPLLGDQSTYPTRNNIWRWLERQRQNSQSEATGWRWFFFSGYGVSWNQADYLMPIDGDPNNIPGTGIPVRSLLASLKAGGSDNVLVLLDINRSPGLQTGAPVGAETVELARQMGIALMLSSQLNEYSHEAAALGNGLFTAALLEALRYYRTDTTLEKLDRYLRDRLPELCQHHWRPIQTPLTAIPAPVAKQQLLLPTAVNSIANAKAAAGVGSTALPRRNLDTGNSRIATSRTPIATPLETPPRAPEQGQSTSIQNPYERTSSMGRSNIPVRDANDRHLHGQLGQAGRSPSTFPDSNIAAPRQTASSSGAMIHSPQQAESAPKKTAYWQKLLLWGSAVLGLMLLIAAVVLRHWDTFVAESPNQTAAIKESPQPTRIEVAPVPPPIAETDASKPQPATAPQTVSPERLQANQAALERAKRLIQPNQASLFNKAIVEARQVKLGDPLYEEARADIQRWSAVILDLAEGRAQQGRLASAIAAAQLVPKDDPALHNQARQRIQEWKVRAAQWQKNQDIIQTAQQQIKPNQASSYSRAIIAVRQIPPNQPGYARSQALIEQWSQQIYQIANTRAAKGQFEAAAVTAKLVPQNTPTYNPAQQAIAKWQRGKQQQQNQQIIAKAKQQIRENQASSYNRAISTLRQIAPSQSGYAEARELIQQWSRQIYLIANTRAAKNQFEVAVLTAKLVPQDTPSHSSAQKAIAKWQQGKR